MEIADSVLAGCASREDVAAEAKDRLALAGRARKALVGTCGLAGATLRREQEHKQRWDMIGGVLDGCRW